MLRLVVLLTALTNCAASLPEYAKGSATLTEGGDTSASGLVPYRTLARSDFRGKKVPPEFAAVADRVGAATCGKVMTTPGTGLQIIREQRGSEKPRYRVRVKHLSFRAFMDPECSFWNDTVAKFSPPYVLEHEQIHFALFELGARRLNASADALSEDIEDEGSSREKLQKKAEDTLRDAVKKEMARIVDQNQDFDSDTSLGYKPDKQSAWKARVMAELKEMANWAR